MFLVIFLFFCYRIYGDDSILLYLALHMHIYMSETVFYSSLYIWYIKFRHAAENKCFMAKSPQQNLFGVMCITHSNREQFTCSLLFFLLEQPPASQFKLAFILFFVCVNAFIITLMESTTNILGSWHLPTCAYLCPPQKSN